MGLQPNRGRGKVLEKSKAFLRLDKDICMMMRMIQEREQKDIEEKRIATTMFLSKPKQTENMIQLTDGRIGYKFIQ